MYALRIFGFVDGVPFPAEGLYLEDFDFEAHNGLGEGTFDLDPDAALRFESFDEAMVYYNTVSKKYPKSDDGTPNCPLTRSRVQVILLP